MLDSAALVAAMRDRARIVLDVDVLPDPPTGVPEPDELEGRWLLGRHLTAAHLRCRAPEWSLDMAAFTTDIVAHAARTTGISEPLLVSVFRAGTDSSPRGSSSIHPAQ